MNNGDAERERTRRGVILRIGLLMTFFFLFFDSGVQQRQRAGGLSTTTTTITQGISSNPNTNELLLATPTPQQSALFLERLNQVIAVDTNAVNARGLTQVFPRNISGLFQGDYHPFTPLILFLYFNPNPCSRNISGLFQGDYQPLLYIGP